jgi:hypothetical protein
LVQGDLAIPADDSGEDVRRRIDLQRHLKSGLISFLSGAPIRIGFDKADGKGFNLLFNNRFIDRRQSSELRFGASAKLGWPTSLREALSVIARAQVAVGSDSGLCISLPCRRHSGGFFMGATSPARTGPYGFDDLVVQGRPACVPYYRRRCSIGRICMKSIGRDEIEAKIASALMRTQ